jgi:aminoglycoside 3-N-acetyltransferase
MSNVLVGKHQHFVKEIGKYPVGKDSTFDLIHRSDLKVKFLFLGPKMGDCFTYMHYIEDERKVPYRYNRTFSGEITDNGNTYHDSYELFVRYNNVFAGGGSYIYENIMFERGISKRTNIGDGLLSVVEERPAYNCYVELLNLSPSFYITEPFDPANNTTEFKAVNMVAL